MGDYLRQQASGQCMGMTEQCALQVFTLARAADLQEAEEAGLTFFFRFSLLSCRDLAEARPVGLLQESILLPSPMFP
eukprot:1137702-Pelagomonas_calceolata.AAC.7